MSRMLTLQAGDVIEFADGAEITSALVLLATDASVILDRCDGSTPTVITYEELGEVRRFWTEHVEADVPPPADAHPATTAALGRIPRDPDAIVDLDDHRDLLTAYAAAKRQAGAAKAELAGLANEIRAALGEAEVGHVAGVPVVLYPLRTRKPYTVEGGTYRSLTVRWKDPNP